MTHKTTLKALLAAAGEAAGERARQEARIAARIAWAERRIADLKAAQQRVQDAWDRIFDALPDDIDDAELEAMDIPEPEEQAEVDAIWAELHAVREHDRWPKHLYWIL